ncbi:MAG: hypothetical protein IMW99_05230 [Firmicutes bacterium]|nr:hypothetical protein [Bacillota bacterium]
MSRIIKAEERLDCDPYLVEAPSFPEPEPGPEPGGAATPGLGTQPGAGTQRVGRADRETPAGPSADDAYRDGAAQSAGKVGGGRRETGARPAQTRVKVWIPAGKEAQARGSRAYKGRALLAPGRSAVARIRTGAEEQANRVLQEARQAAEALRAEAQALKDQAHQQGHEEGFAQGRREGYEQGLEQGRGEGREAARSEVLAQCQLVARMAQELAQDRQQLLEAVAGDVVKLAWAIAEKIVHGQVQSDPELVQRTVRSVLSQLGDDTRVVLRVNPAELEQVLNWEPRFRTLLSTAAQLEIRGDPQVERGGCVAESAGTQVDGRLSTQLAEVDAALRRVVAGGNSGGSTE